VFWAHASNTARLEQSFREIADQVKVRGRKDPQADVFKLVHDWLRDEKNGRWLLVLDNADDAAVLSPTDGGALQQHLSRYIPSSRHGSVLVTSRTKRAAMQVVEDSDIIPIEPMHDAAAHALLRKKLRDVDDDDDDSIATLATTLDHMPLALVQAAAYIRERAPRCSVRQYLEEYRQSDSRKTSLLNREAGHLRRDAAASNSVLITWQISFDHIRSTRQSAAGLLSLMSFFDRQGIQEALLRRQSSTADEGFGEDVLALRDYSFITVTRDASTFEMHSLVQLAMRAWLESEGQLDKWRAQFISNLCAELPTGEHKNWEKCQALFPHAQAALAQRPKDRGSLKEWALLLYKAAWYAWQRGTPDDAEQMSLLSKEAAKETFGKESAEVSSSMTMVANVRKLMGRWKEAELEYAEALRILRSLSKTEDRGILTLMSNIATTYRAQGLLQEAENLTKEVLEKRKHLLGWNDPETLASMANLALIFLDQAKLHEAEELGYEVMEIRKSILGEEHPETLTSIATLASTYFKQQLWKKAEALEVEVVKKREEVLGSEHRDTLISMSNLARLYFEQGQHEEGHSLCEEVKEKQERVLGKEHPDTLGSLANLMVMYQQQEWWEDAEKLGMQVLKTRSELLGPEHPDTLTSMRNLVSLLYNRGKYEGAALMCRQTLARYKKVLGHEHPSTLACMHLFAHLLAKLGHYDESSMLRERPFIVHNAALGTRHRTSSVCSRHYSKQHSLYQQDQRNCSSIIFDRGAITLIRKSLRLERGLAGLGIAGSRLR
jgi:aromatic ring-cleaving dioxygenase